MPEVIPYEVSEIIIDDELKALLPTLSTKAYELLEESLLEHGCLHPLVLWENILIDGYNRYEIAKKHAIPFTVETKEFNSRDDAIVWIITTQIARRNLNAKQLSYYRGKHYKMEKRLIKNEKGNNQYNMVLDHFDLKPPGENTARRLAKQYNVSEPTIKRDEQFADAIDTIGQSSPEAKRNILAGTTDITRKHLRELMISSEDDIVDTAKKIEDGTFEKPKPASPQPPSIDTSYAPDEIKQYRNVLLINVADNFAAAMRELIKDNNDLEIIKALRAHINVLESLYIQF